MCFCSKLVAIRRWESGHFEGGSSIWYLHHCIIHRPTPFSWRPLTVLRSGVRRPVVTASSETRWSINHLAQTQLSTSSAPVFAFLRGFLSADLPQQTKSSHPPDGLCHTTNSIWMEYCISIWVESNNISIVVFSDLFFK